MATRRGRWNPQKPGACFVSYRGTMHAMTLAMNTTETTGYESAPSTTTTMNTPLKITSRARNLGLGSTSEVIRHRLGVLAVKEVDSPDVTGGLATIERELHRIHRAYGDSTHYRVRLFVAGRPVLCPNGLGLALAELREFGETVVSVKG